MDKVVHFEVPAGNVARAKKFYSGIFGWDISSVPNMDYSMVKTGQKSAKKAKPDEWPFINGGMLKRQGQIKSPIITINVKSIEKTAMQIKSRGGKIVVGKQPVGNMGFTAYFKDCEGNILGLWENA